MVFDSMYVPVNIRENRMFLLHPAGTIYYQLKNKIGLFVIALVFLICETLISSLLQRYEKNNYVLVFYQCSISKSLLEEDFHFDLQEGIDIVHEVPWHVCFLRQVLYPLEYLGDVPLATTSSLN